MATDHLLSELRDGILTLTMNRPEKLNAMSAEMMNALVDELTRASQDAKVGCVVLTGAGRGFCAGGDVGSMNQANTQAQAGTAPPPSLEESVARLRRSEQASALLH